MTVLRRDEALLDAGSLTFAMLQFAESAAHPSHGATPPDTPRLGAEAYMFAPSYRLVPLNEVPAFLANLPSPALLMPSTTQGVIALLLLDELSGERAAAARHQLANQRAGVDQFAAQLGLTENSPILLEAGDEERVVSLGVLRLWSERFALDIGWY